MTTDRTAIVAEISTEGRVLRFLKAATQPHGWTRTKSEAARFDVDDAQALAAEENGLWNLKGSLRRCRAMHPDDAPDEVITQADNVAVRLLD